MQGYHLKCVERQENVSAICSAFTGEVIKYTTVRRQVLDDIYFMKFIFLILEARFRYMTQDLIYMDVFSQNC